MHYSRKLTTAMVAVAALASAQCSKISTPASPGAVSRDSSISVVAEDGAVTSTEGNATSGRMVLGDSTVNSNPAFGQIRVCKVGNVSGTFNFSGAGGTVTTSPNGTVIAPSVCTVVAQDSGTPLVGPPTAGASITVTESPSTNLVSVTLSRIDDNPIRTTTGLPFTNGVTQLFVNNFHGYTITFTNNVTPPAKLAVNKTPNAGTFTSGGQASFSIVVSNPAAAGSSSATSVTLSDQLPGNGGLVWTTATPTQGTCSISATNLLTCALGTIAPQSSVTVTVTTGATTPAAACQTQNNPAANASAAGGLTATDAGSLSCTPPPPQGVLQGCTPGYFKQDQHFGSWKVYSRTADFDATFGVNFFNPNITLLQALQNGGGGNDALGRHAVAALLNAAAGSGVNYTYTTPQVIAIVQGTGAYAGLSVEARKDLLAAANEKGCPLGRAEL